MRVLSEIGFAGGGGFMVYATIGVQFGPPPAKKVRRDSAGRDPRWPFW